jgi:hypothetical protein
LPNTHPASIISQLFKDEGLLAQQHQEYIHQTIASPANSLKNDDAHVCGLTKSSNAPHTQIISQHFYLSQNR